VRVIRVISIKKFRNFIAAIVTPISLVVAVNRNQDNPVKVEEGQADALSRRKKITRCKG
jgi:hypothetical protein